MSTLKGNKEIAISGKHKDSVQRKMLVASATTKVSVEKEHNRPLLLKDRTHKMTGHVLRKGDLPEAVVIKERAEIPLVKAVRIRHVINGILP